MTYYGIIRDGRIYIEGGLSFPDGTRVEIDIVWRVDPNSPEWRELDEIDPATGKMKPQMKMVMRVIEWPNGAGGAVDQPSTVG